MTRVLLWSTAALTLISWFPAVIRIDAEALTREAGNISQSDRVSHFLTKLTPKPVQESGSWSEALPWASDLWSANGSEAITNTIAMATAAIVISAFATWLLLPWASRALASAQPLGIFSGRVSPLINALWKAC